MPSKSDAAGVATRLLHGARDLIWQDDPGQRKTAAVAQTQTSIPAAPTANPETAATTAMSAELLALVLNRPTAYSALTDAIAALDDIAMDDVTRYRAAFAVLKKTQQRSVDQIVQAIDIHLGLLEDERSRFASQSRQAEDSGVAVRQQSIAALNQSALALAEQMTRLRSETDARLLQLQQQQSQKQAEASTLERQVATEKTSIERTTHTFDGAAATVEKILHDARVTVRQRLAGES